MKLNTLSSFSELVKEEICLNKNFKNFTKKVIILTIIKNIGEINLFNNSIEFKTRYYFVIKFIKTNLKTLFANTKLEIAKSNTKTLKDKKTNYLLTFHNFDVNMLTDIFNNINYSNHDLVVGIIIGTFLSTGSISNPYQNKYHLEIRLVSEDLKDILFKCFQVFYIQPKLIFYRKKWIIYFKKSEYLSDILKLLGANESMFFLEDNRIEHDLVNNMQRLINLEISNIQKISKASVEQVSKCKILLSDYRFSLLNSREQLYCKIRVQFPNYSMNQICDEMNKLLTDNQKITKGSLCHIINKIRKIYKSTIF